MLTKEEIQGFESILRKLSNDDIMSLKDTVTNRKIAVEGVKEAIKVIITYSDSSRDLLRRKKINRDILFQYLYDCKVVVSPNLDKSRLIDKILEYWKSDQTLDTTSSSLNVSRTELSSLDCKKVIASAAVINQEDQALAETFVTWFYKMLNSQNPFMNQVPEDFGPQHFWNDSKLILKTNQTNEIEEFEGCDIVCQRFLAFMKEEFLLFNPNVSAEGVKLQKDPHGLIMISVCGTIHKENNCLGTFQELFGIIRDPRFENNWKIKTTTLGMRASQVTSIPTLTNNSDMLAISNG
ncbi:hypothetical protein LOTGIDRAFT_128762 [Lottia gigantea]|uniref:NTF2 domain-containing protein n=1 Tax=Lottia gigantea TaxID=225164 RepID=V3ZQR3_LOTGI|nr:hypothetical protein LOTGIDRAFT_128762 [Lottia gigantea]ESO86692.1 hypothetical protein LOTGIDRAFT_128762 [Lottia gigantea]